MIHRRNPRKPALKAAVLLALCTASIAVGQEAKAEASPLPWSDAKMIALAGAIEADDPARIDQCIADGADVNFAGENKVTPLAWSIVEQKKRAFRRLLELGADPNCVDNAGRSPLIVAAECNEFDLVELLLKAGADYRHKDAKGRDLLYEFIATSPDAQNHGTDLKQKAAVWLAAQSRERVLEWLLDKGVGFAEAESRMARSKRTTEQIRSWWRESAFWAVRRAPAEPKDARGFRLRASARMFKSDYALCVDDSTEAIRLEPNNAAGYLLRGRAWHELGHSSDSPLNAYDRAIADFTEAIRIDAHRADGYADRAAAWKSKRDYGKALADYSEAITREPSSAAFYWRRAEARVQYAFSVGEPDGFTKAIDDCNRSIELDGEDPRAYHARGVARCRLSKVDDAIADQTQAIELDPDYVQAYIDRGYAWNLKGLLVPRSRKTPRPAEVEACIAKAIGDTSEAIRIDPKYAFAFWTRAMLWESKGDFDQAIADYSEAIRLEPGTAYYISRAEAWRTKHDYDKAIVDYSEAIRLNSAETWKLAQAYNGRGEVWLAEKQYQKAVDDITEAIRLNGHFASRGDRRAAWRAMGKFQNILDDLKAFAQEKPERPDAWRELAWFLATCPDAALRDGQQAIDFATKARDLWANSEPEWLRGTKVAPEMAASFKESRKKGLSDDAATLAAAYAEVGNFEEAIQSQTKAIELSRSDQERDEHRRRLALYQHRERYRDADSDDDRDK